MKSIFNKQSLPLVVHIIHRLDIGGMENGLVNLLNNFPADSYRHAIICLTNASEFKNRISSSDVEIFSLYKKEGKGLGVYWRLWRLLKALHPDLVHTRNFATLECQLPAYLAGTSIRIHGEHGWDVFDVSGRSRKYRLLRKLYSLFISQYICVSDHLALYLRDCVNISESRITRIYNGVDTVRFSANTNRSLSVLPDGFASANSTVIGTVGRLQPIKDQLTLIRSFERLCDTWGESVSLRLVIAGDGPMRKDLQREIENRGLRHKVWLAGAVDDIPALLRDFTVFVLPSIAEGISNTILEAMATGLPVVATKVGGTPEIVADCGTGYLVPVGNDCAMADAISRYIKNPELAVRHGDSGRERALNRFSLQTMVDAYRSVYDTWLSVGVQEGKI